MTYYFILIPIYKLFYIRYILLILDYYIFRIANGGSKYKKYIFLINLDRIQG